MMRSSSYARDGRTLLSLTFLVRGENIFKPCSGDKSGSKRKPTRGFDASWETKSVAPILVSSQNKEKHHQNLPLTIFRPGSCTALQLAATMKFFGLMYQRHKEKPTVFLHRPCFTRNRISRPKISKIDGRLQEDKRLSCLQPIYFRE